MGEKHSSSLSACVGFPRVDYHCSVPQGELCVHGAWQREPTARCPTLSPGLKPELLHCWSGTRRLFRADLHLQLQEFCPEPEKRFWWAFSPNEHLLLNSFCSDKLLILRGKPRHILRGKKSHCYYRIPTLLMRTEGHRDFACFGCLLVGRGDRKSRSNPATILKSLLRSFIL